MSNLLTNLLSNLINKKHLYIKISWDKLLEVIMKKYLLLIEDEKLWEKFKVAINKDINSEIIDLIKKKTNGGKNGK